MQRRTFLEVVAVAAGGLVLASGCNDDDDPNASDDYNPLDVFPQSVASGDPKPNSVVLWTRVVDADRSDEDLSLTLEVALDKSFSQKVSLGQGDTMDLVARADADHCVKVRVEGLEPATTYFYRFKVDREGKTTPSRVGRTRTAPARDADVPVRFAVMSCQDYNGRYYHALRLLAARDEIDFFVHLGDYVYETTGDPSFQETAGDRRVRFSEPDEAISLGSGDSTYYAARSLSNYRDLYKTYRGDHDLQRLHELFPMVAIWDDHEFSDDCFGATATYFDGAEDELDLERRANADQAWFEYMPVDYVAGSDFEYDRSVEFPDDLKIYRDLQFGRHVHLVMTDLRRYRSEHLIPEEAFPGAMAVTQSDLEEVFGEVPDGAVPYIDIETYGEGAYQEFAAAVAEGLGSPAEQVRGPISAGYINQAIEAAEEAGNSAPPAIDLSDTELERGIAYHQLLKTGAHSIVGSRYLVVRNAFEAIAAVRFAQTEGASETGMGAEQRAWFLETMRDSEATWKVWGNEYTFMRRTIDLAAVPSEIPEVLKTQLIMSAEDWDGMPNRREQLLGELAALSNVVVVTGDIHAFFAGTPYLQSDPEQRIVEFVCGAVSSGTYRQLLTAQAAADPTLSASGGTQLASLVGTLLTAANDHLAMQDVAKNGVATIVADGNTFDVTFHKIGPSDVQNPDPGSLSTIFETEHFKVEAGAPDLYRERGGEWQRWDVSEGWV